jgi:hypothetical protein
MGLETDVVADLPACVQPAISRHLSRGERPAVHQFEALTNEKSWHFMEADQDLDTVFVE